MWVAYDAVEVTDVQVCSVQDCHWRTNNSQVCKVCGVYLCADKSTTVRVDLERHTSDSGSNAIGARRIL